MAKILVCCSHPHYISPSAPATVQKRPRTYLYGRFFPHPDKMESARALLSLPGCLILKIMSKEMNGNAARSAHPLVVLLREIRERHPEVTLTEIEACMGIPFDTLRHIEKGRRPLPGLQDGLGRWILHLLDCMRATPEERQMVETLLSRIILMEWSEGLAEQ